MIVNDRRGIKKQKDIEKIKAIYPFLDTDEYNRIKDTLTKKEKRIVEKFETEQLLL